MVIIFFTGLLDSKKYLIKEYKQIYLLTLIYIQIFYRKYSASNILLLEIMFVYKPENMC